MSAALLTREQTLRAIKYFSRSLKSDVSPYGLRDPQMAPVQTPDFIPYTLAISGVGGTQQNDILLYFFDRVDAVNAIISYLATTASQIPRKHIKKLANGKEKDLGKTAEMELLDKPNPLNNGVVFCQNNIASFFVFGNVYINKLKALGFESEGFKELWPLPSNRTWIKTRYSIGDFGLVNPSQDWRSNPIVSYNWKLDGKWIYLNPEEVGHLKDTNLQTSFGQYLYGQSRLYSATSSIETLMGIVDIIKSLTNNGGAGGFVKKTSRANQADTAMDPEEKKKIEKNFHENYGYGADKKRIFFTDQDLSYQKIDAALRDYMPIELKEHEFRMLCNVLGGFPASILNDTSASTYNNVETAQKTLYVNVLMPVVKQYYEWLSDELGLTERNEALIADFEAVEVLQANKKAEAQKLKITAEGAILLMDAHLISRNDALEIVGLERNPDPKFDEIAEDLSPTAVSEAIQSAITAAGINKPPNPDGVQQNNEDNQPAKSSLYRIQLSKSWIDFLKSQPESGIGYQVVDVMMKSGKGYPGINVLNCEILLCYDKIDCNDIEWIKLYKF